MDDGKAYWLRNKLESDVGDAVDVTGTISVPDDVGMMFPQPARRNTIRTRPEAVPDFILLRL
jgi:hypothetical protein